MNQEIELIARERPVSERTAVERRNLVIASSAGLALNAGSVKELLGFGTSSADPALAKGAFCLAISYLLVMFIAGFLKDWLHWRTAKTIVDFTIDTSKFKESYLQLMWGAQMQPIQIPAVLDAPLRAMNEACMTLDKGQHTAVKATKSLATFEVVRLYVLDFILPVGLGVTAFFRLYEFVPPFVKTALS